MAAENGGGSGGDANGKPAGLSLSFGNIKAKAKVSAAGSAEAKRLELITGIGASGVVAAEGQAAAAGPKIIPKQVRAVMRQITVHLIQHDELLFSPSPGGAHLLPGTLVKPVVLLSNHQDRHAPLLQRRVLRE